LTFAITLRLFVGGIGRVATGYAGRDVAGKTDLSGPAGVGAVARTLNREERGGVRGFAESRQDRESARSSGGVWSGDGVEESTPNAVVADVLGFGPFQRERNATEYDERIAVVAE
jgi:hypothetical protein